MKKYFGFTMIIAVLSFILLSNEILAQKGQCKNQDKYNCSKFVDANGDGKCDNFVDTNGDGKCDNCSGKGICDGTGKGMGKCKNNCGKFVDANGDGKCDNYVDINGDGKCDNCSGKGICDGTGKGKCQNNNKANCGNSCKMKNCKVTNSNFTLNQNVPNPVIGNTKISFNLKEANNVKVVLSDKIGNKVKDVFEGNLSIGDHEVELNVSDLNPGNYFYSVYVGGKVQTKQLIVVK